MNNSAKLITRFARKFQRPGSVLALVICAALAFVQVIAAASAAAAYNLLARNPVGLAPIALGATTLSTTEILLDIIQGVKKQCPWINRMGTDFTKQPLKLNKQYIAHIPTLPSIATYDTMTGYANGATSARSLLVDIPITVSNHKHVPLKFEHLNLIKDDKNKYGECISLASYVLGKAMVDDVLSGVTSRNFSQSSTYAEADCDADMLTNVQGDLNTQGALPRGRIMLINTAGANAMAVDSRITSKDFAGQQPNGEGYRRFVNTHGFAEIVEYPDFPGNNGSQVTGVTAEADDEIFTKAAHGFLDGDRVTFVSGTGFTGITAGTKYFVRDATATTFKLAATSGGAAINITLDGSAGVFQLAENLVAFGFDMRAIALMAGAPDISAQNELIAALGIPQVMKFEVVTDEESGLTMAGVSWQASGTGDLYFSPVLLWGYVAGKQAAATASGVATDNAGHRVVSA